MKYKINKGAKLVPEDIYQTNLLSLDDFSRKL